jgi:nitrogen fixation NifU-like protein
MSIWLEINDGRIVDARFLTDGCGTSRASGSMATEMAKGKSLAEARKISQKDVLNGLGGLPLLASNTLKEAINDYMVSKMEPKKRDYPVYLGMGPKP